jgi:energy-coupling factor transporter transmembrane protein EcfT
LISRQGVLEGCIVCWRLFLVVILSLVFIATTRISRIKRSVAWIFSSVPGVPEKRVATMLGLIVRFIPVIFKRAGEVTAAQHARCVGLRKNPLFRLKTFSLPLLGGVFRDAGNLAMAMEARCYTEQGIRGVAPASKKDWVVLVAGIGLCGAAWMA